MRPRDARFGELLAVVAGRLVEGAQVLAEVLTDDAIVRDEARGRLADVDHQAESATLAVLSALSAAFVTPIDRTEIYRVAWSLRVCVARMDAAADEIVLFDLRTLPNGVSDLVQLVISAADVTAEAVPALARPKYLSDPWLELTRLGKQSGQTHRRLLAEITSHAKDPASMVRLTSVAQSLRRVVEAFEDVAHALQTVAVKEA
jgi:hypothetical protein